MASTIEPNDIKLKTIIPLILKIFSLPTICQLLYTVECSSLRTTTDTLLMKTEFRALLALICYV